MGRIRAMEQGGPGRAGRKPGRAGCMPGGASWRGQPAAERAGPTGWPSGRGQPAGRAGGANRLAELVGPVCRCAPAAHALRNRIIQFWIIRFRVPRATKGILSLPSASFQPGGAYCECGLGVIRPHSPARPVAAQPSRRLDSTGPLARQVGSALAAATKYADTEQRWWRCGTIRATAAASDLRRPGQS
jgi:hypothetical protein